MIFSSQTTEHSMFGSYLAARSVSTDLMFAKIPAVTFADTVCNGPRGSKMKCHFLVFPRPIFTYICVITFKLNYSAVIEVIGVLC